jgi:hypothetical protein
VAETSCGAGPAGTSGSATPAGSATTYVSTVQASSPAAFYRLAEPAATTVMADSSGNAADGAYSGQGTLGEPAPLLTDPATSANYTTCCSGIGTGNSALPQYNASRTVEAWFNTTSGTTNMALAGYGPTTTNEAFIVSLSTHSINVDTYNDYLSFPTPRGVNDGNWHMAAVTYNGTNVVVYLDGQQIGSSPFAGTVNTLNPSGLEVGYNSGYNAFKRPTTPTPTSPARPSRAAPPVSAPSPTATPPTARSARSRAAWPAPCCRPRSPATPTTPTTRSSSGTAPPTPTTPTAT